MLFIRPELMGERRQRFREADHLPLERRTCVRSPIQFARPAQDFQTESSITRRLRAEICDGPLQSVRGVPKRLRVAALNRRPDIIEKPRAVIQK